MEKTTKKTKVLVWDLPTRVFHWLLAATFVGAFLTADSERLRDVHVALSEGAREALERQARGASES